MRIELINVKSYEEHNADYNDDVKEGVEAIFQTQDEEPIGYVVSDDSNFDKEHYRLIIPKIKNLINLLARVKISKHCRLNIKDDELGKLELKLLEKVFNSEYSVIFLTGAVGSGKTSIIKYIQKYYNMHYNHDRCAYRDNCKIRINIFKYYDFNEEYENYNIEQIKHNVLFDIYEMFKDIVYQILSETDVVHEFIEDVRSNKMQQYNYHYNKFYKAHVHGNDEWNIKTNSMKADAIISWIDSYEATNGINEEFKLIRSLVKYVCSKYGGKNKGCVTIALDNIDGLKIETQKLLMDKILRFANHLSIRFIVPVRLTTFKKIISWGSFSYGVFENAGANPLNIIKKRINYFLNNIDNPYFSTHMSGIGEDFHRGALINRAHNVKSVIDSNGWLTKVLLCLSGNSIRRGLFLSERLFRNYKQNYAEDYVYDHEAIRALLAGTNDNCLFSKEDTMCSNIFICNRYNTNNIITIKILDYLQKEQNRNEIVRMGQLIDFINMYEEWDEDQIFRNIECLMSYRKRLIWVDGVGEYTNYKDIEKSRQDYVNITSTGRRYLGELVFIVEYLAMCFLSINWDVNTIINNRFEYMLHIEKIINNIKNNKCKMTSGVVRSVELYVQMMNDIHKGNVDTSAVLPKYVDQNILIDRTNMIRKCLELLLFQEICLSLKWTDNNFNNRYEYSNTLLIYNIIYKVTHAIITIYGKGMNDEQMEEIYSWLSLNIIANEWAGVFNCRKDENIDELYAEIGECLE